MHTAAAETSSFGVQPAAWLAADGPVLPIRDYGMPIQPYKRPPTEDDFERRKPRKKRPPDAQEPEQPGPAQGHVDDFA